jgi:hypothetical protein
MGQASSITCGEGTTQKGNVCVVSQVPHDNGCAHGLTWVAEANMWLPTNTGPVPGCSLDMTNSVAQTCTKHTTSSECLKATTNGKYRGMGGASVCEWNDAKGQCAVDWGVCPTEAVPYATWDHKDQRLKGFDYNAYLNACESLKVQGDSNSRLCKLNSAVLAEGIGT